MTHEELRAWRQAHGWTQKDAARALGIALRTYQDREWGVVPIRREVALAVAALNRGLRPYGKKARQ